jgi:hypothetical protein
MNVLVDTPVWSLAFRKKNNAETSPIVDNLIELVRNVPTSAEETGYKVRILTF